MPIEPGPHHPILRRNSLLLLFGLSGLWLVLWQEMSSPAAPPCPIDNPQTLLHIGDTELRVEIARSEHARRCGLSQRDHLARGTGMLFIFPHADYWAFWMRNTHFPLTLAFIDDQHYVSQIAHLKPHDLSEIHSTRKLRYALEMHPQDATSVALRIGKRIPLTEVIAETPEAIAETNQATDRH